MLLVALAAVTLAGFLAFPTYPNYDSYYALLWGRELLHGTLPSFEAYRAPTEHPLTIAFGALLALFGQRADLLMVAATFVSFVALAAGMYRLGRASFGTLTGLVAAGLLCTRFDIPFLAARAYVDIPYLAIVVWAAAIEAERPRRGTPVFVLLAVAGLMRPDAWVLSGVYWLWCLPGASWPRRAWFAALTALGPVVWAAVDFAVTGDPLFSLTHTSGLAEELGRSAGLSEVPAATLRFLDGLDKWPVLVAAVLGVAIALGARLGRVRVPLALLAVGVGTFAAVTLAGLSVVFRYLLLPAVVLLVFAAVPLTGWTLLAAGDRARRWWAAAAAALVLAGLVFTVTHTTPSSFATELRFRGQSQEALRDLLLDPRVAAARRCGPVSVPNHKLVPRARWVLDAGENDVIARSDRSQRARARRGVAIFAAGRLTLLQEGYPPDSYRLAIPRPGFELVAVNGFYAAWARC